ncbi:MAG: DUF6460 domain-containing protein [Rhodospirillales bacterium]|jgi:hypothetical protein|nr:DUF6460 domain-containing protein [Rhodospirillales bacterium]
MFEPTGKQVTPSRIQVMPSRIKETAIKIAIASLIIGLLLGFFDIDPRELLAYFGETVQHMFSVVAPVVEWAVKYVLLGAIVVVPIWLTFFAIGWLRNRDLAAGGHRHGGGGGGALVRRGGGRNDPLGGWVKSRENPMTA